jgi:hypothetical protein
MKARAKVEVTKARVPGETFLLSQPEMIDKFQR